MSVSRRAFVTRLTSGPGPSAEFIAARGYEAWVGEHWPLEYQRQRPAGQAGRDMVRLSSNENPLGPNAAAIEAIKVAFGYAGRYPMNAKPSMNDFKALVARKLNLKPENINLGAGSGEVLDNAMRAFTSTSRGLVAGEPTYEQPGRMARQLKVPLQEIPVDAAGRLDCEKMIAASRGAGLVFVCNPNNPTATVHSAKTITDLVSRISKASPDTVILVDEAYHDYVTDPSYASAVALVPQYPNLLIARTMSKAHGMAGLRLGYAVGQAGVIKKLAAWTMPYNANAMVLGAAYASLEDEAALAREKRRNTEVRKYTMDFFSSAGFKPTDSQANFIFVDIRRPASEFRSACQGHGIAVGRDFPPFEKTHARISIGTMEEMQKATAVFRTVLGLTTASGGGKR
jgi:histidinol-phosphate aminotransferase